MTNRRSILLLLLGIALLVAVHAAIRSCGDGGRTDRRRTLVAGEEPVLRMKIERRGDAPVVLRREEEVGWRIVEPFVGRVDERAVARLLDALCLTPVVDVVAEGELVRLGRTFADFSLSEPLVKVTVGTEKGEEAVSFGMPTPSADGVYAAVGSLGAVFVVPSEVLSAVDRPTEEFRRRALFSSRPESVSSFVLRRGTGSILSFVRETDGWTVDGGKASSAQVESFLSELMSAEAVGFVWPVGASNETERVSASLLAGYGLEPENAVTVTLKGFDRADRQLSLGRASDPGLVYASVLNGSAVVTVKDTLKTKALQPKTAFADDRLFPVAESAVGFFRLVDGDDSYVLARAEGGTWRVESPVSAPAESAVVGRILARMLALPASAASDAVRSFAVSMSADSAPVCVPRERVLGDDRLDDLRSVEIVRIDPKEVKRLVRTSGEKGALPVSLVRGREDGAWTLESADDHAVVRSGNVATVLSALNPLVAKRVERIKLSAADLDGYGLGIPFLTVAVDLDRENAVRRNVLIGAKTKGGRFATVGSADAVFVISTETVERLAAELIGR